MRLPGVDPAADEASQVQRRQPVALLVFGDLCISVRREIADRDGHFPEARSPRRPESLGAEVKAVPAAFIGRVNDQGLQDAARRDVVRQLNQLCVGELRARVALVLDHAVDRHHEWRTDRANPLVDWSGPRYLCGQCWDASASGAHVRNDRCHLAGVEQVELLHLQFGPKRAHGRSCCRIVR